MKIKSFMGAPTGRVYWHNAWRNCATLTTADPGYRGCLFRMSKRGYRYQQTMQGLRNLYRVGFCRFGEGTYGGNIVLFRFNNDRYGGAYVATRRGNVLRVRKDLAYSRDPVRWRALCRFAQEQGCTLYCDPRDTKGESHGW